MERKRTPDQLHALNQVARTARNAPAPAEGITSSAEALAHAIDNIAMQTLNQCAIRATHFHIKTPDMLNAVIQRLEGHRR